MLFSEMIKLYGKKKAEFLSVTSNGTYTYHRALNG